MLKRISYKLNYLVFIMYHISNVLYLDLLILGLPFVAVGFKYEQVPRCVVVNSRIYRLGVVLENTFLL